MIDDEKLKEMLTDPGNVTLHCMICTDPMPPARARDSKRKTCCANCYRALKAFYKEMVKQRYCPSCLHPSTPRQRADFKLWATDRGHRKGGREEGRPAKKREIALEKALAGLLGSLKGVEGFEAPQMSGDDSVEQREARIATVGASIETAAKLLEVPTVK